MRALGTNTAELQSGTTRSNCRAAVAFQKWRDSRGNLAVDEFEAVD
jgi:hypothetical protein